MPTEVSARYLTHPFASQELSVLVDIMVASSFVSHIVVELIISVNGDDEVLPNRALPLLLRANVSRS
jgi:hypothetical protein